MDYHPPERGAGLSTNFYHWDPSTETLPSVSSVGVPHVANTLAGISACEDDEDTSSPLSEVDIAARRTAARMRQVDIGKARPEYQRYVASVQKEERTPSRPCTPDPAAPLSKRQFDRLLSEWRRQLHEYEDPSDPPDTSGSTVIATASSASSSASVSTLLPDYKQVSQAVPAWPSSSLTLRGSEAAPLKARTLQNSLGSINGSGLQDKRYDRHNPSREPLRAPLPQVQGSYGEIWASAEQPLRTTIPDHHQHLSLNPENACKAMGSVRSIAGLGVTADGSEISAHPQVGLGSDDLSSRDLLKDIPMKVFVNSPFDGAPPHNGSRRGLKCAQADGYHEKDSSEGCPVT